MVKELVKESKYVNLFYEEEAQLITAVWLPSTEELYDNEEFKEAALLTAEICEEYKPKVWLVDNRTMLYTLDPDLHIWVDQELTLRYQATGLTKMAFVFIPPEEPEEIIFEKLSTEQLMEVESTKEAWQTQFFTTIDEARKWLLN